MVIKLPPRWLRILLTVLLLAALLIGLRYQP